MTYDEFWLQYLRAHSRVNTRVMHYIGSLCAVFALGLGALNWRWFIAAPIIGYGCAWSAHAVFERNRPETFGHPLWSLLSDYRMLSLAVTRRLSPHLRRAGVR